MRYGAPAINAWKEFSEIFFPGFTHRAARSQGEVGFVVKILREQSCQDSLSWSAEANQSPHMFLCSKGPINGLGLRLSGSLPHFRSGRKNFFQKFRLLLQSVLIAVFFIKKRGTIHMDFKEFIQDVVMVMWKYVIIWWRMIITRHRKVYLQNIDGIWLAEYQKTWRWSSVF